MKSLSTSSRDTTLPRSLLFSCIHCAFSPPLQKPLPPAEHFSLVNSLCNQDIFTVVQFVNQRIGSLSILSRHYLVKYKMHEKHGLAVYNYNYIQLSRHEGKRCQLTKSPNKNYLTLVIKEITISKNSQQHQKEKKEQRKIKKIYIIAQGKIYFHNEIRLVNTTTHYQKKI